MVERSVLVDEDIRVVDDRPFVAVFEVMAVLVGGAVGLPAERLGGIDQGERRLLLLEVDEDARNLGFLGHRHAQDAAAVRLAEGEGVPDGLLAEPEAAALLLGHALRRYCRRVERPEGQAAAGRGFEAEVVVAVAAELLELGPRPVVHGLGPEEEGERVERGGLLVEEIADVPVEKAGDPLERAE